MGEHVFSELLPFRPPLVTSAGGPAGPVERIELTPRDQKGTNGLLVKRVQHHNLGCGERAIVPGDSARHDNKATSCPGSQRDDRICDGAASGFTPHLVEPIQKEHRASLLDRTFDEISSSLVSLYQRIDEILNQACIPLRVGKR